MKTQKLLKHLLGIMLTLSSLSLWKSLNVLHFSHTSIHKLFAYLKEWQFYKMCHVKCIVSTCTIGNPSPQLSNKYLLINTFYIICNVITELLLIWWICMLNQTMLKDFFQTTGCSLVWRCRPVFRHEEPVSGVLSGSPHPSLLSQCLFKEAQGVHEL